MRDYVKGKPNNWRAEQFVQDLAIERYRATNDLTKQITAAACDPENYDENIKEIVGYIDAGKKEALAEYVIHRKHIIELVEAAQKYNEDGKYSPEDRIHDLVFKRFTDSKNKNYFEHNLWLIDDTLAFLPYVTSDRTMHGGRRAKGNKVTDLLLFDDSIVLGDTDGATVTIVEFKKPRRDNYTFGNPKTDPILQVIETMEYVLGAGGVAATDGSHVSFNMVARRFAFIIADLTPTMIKVLKRHDFKNDWNPNVWSRYRDTEGMFIQAFGFTTLVEMAKKRNQAFFSILLGE